jgi:hypothetical protein
MGFSFGQYLRDKVALIAAAWSVLKVPVFNQPAAHERDATA